MKTSALWAGQFGVDYTARNSQDPDRSKFWTRIAEKYKPTSVLEVGCNIGHNLRPLKAALPKAEIWGVDVNPRAVKELREAGIWGDVADATKLPYGHNSFEMVFCIGLLIHMTDEADLEATIREMFRVSWKYVLVAEYWSPGWVNLPYHGYANAQRKGPFDRVIAEIAEGDVIERGYLEAKDGFDRVHYWVYSV